MIDIIRKPIVTEKAMKMHDSGQYVFEVTPDANKIEIKKAIEELFEVNVISVRTTNIKGKIKSRITRKGVMRGKTALKKKAYITVKKGQTIDVVTGAPGA